MARSGRARVGADRLRLAGWLRGAVGELSHVSGDLMISGFIRKLAKGQAPQLFSASFRNGDPCQKKLALRPGMLPSDLVPLPL